MVIVQVTLIKLDRDDLEKLVCLLSFFGGLVILSVGVTGALGNVQHSRKMLVMVRIAACSPPSPPPGANHATTHPPPPMHTHP